MSIMSDVHGNSKEPKQRIAYFFKRFKINRLLRSIRATKEKGISVYALFAFLFELVFTKKNLYQHLIGTHELPFKKDAVYRFLKTDGIPWERIPKELALAVIPEVRKLTSEARKTAFIIDDTPFYRNRSKKVEMLSLQYDHAKNRFYKGFNMLNLGWSDGQTFIPVDFRMLSAGQDRNLLCPSRVAEDGRTLATKRRAASRKDKPSLVLEMLSALRHSPIEAPYVLFDSWFASPSALLNVKHMGYDVVTRLKNHQNYRYLYQGSCLPISQIYKMNAKRRGRSRFLLSVPVGIRHEDAPGTVPAKIVYVRDRNNRKKWIALLSTDVNLTEDEIIALYGKRWDIEPYHKMLKSCLHLETEFQLRSFDAIVAHAAIVVARYIFLALENRESRDDRSIGELYMFVCDELADISFARALALLFSLLTSFLSDRLCRAESVVDSAISLFLADLPDSFNRWKGFMVCES